MTARVYFVPDQIKEKRKNFLEWKSIDLSYNLLHVVVTLTIIKVFIILFLPVGIGNILVILKCTLKLLFQLSVHVYSLLSQIEEGEEGLFWKVQEGGGGWGGGWGRGGEHIVGVPTRGLGCHKRWKSLSSCEIWKNPSTPLFLIRPSYK